jgi:hypothetical protein
MTGLNRKTPNIGVNLTSKPAEKRLILVDKQKMEGAVVRKKGLYFS